MCIFCKIANKEIPCALVYEDDKTLAFLDLAQATKGHTLVIPKKHYDNILECDEETLAHLIQVTQQLARRLTKKLDAKGVNILNNCNETAGQSVMHLHFHIIPRYSKSDTVHFEYQENPNPNLNQLAEDLKKQ